MESNVLTGLRRCPSNWIEATNVGDMVLVLPAFDGLFLR